MSWIHSSKGIALGVLLAVSLLSVGTAAAISVSAEEVPGETQVGEQVSMTITINEPFRDAPDEWTLGGETELNNASWTVTTLQQGRPIETDQYSGESFQQDLDIDSDTTEVELVVEGTVPELSNFSYEDRSVENYTVASVSRVVEGTNNELETWERHRFTEDSQSARQAIAQAERAVANSSSSDAQSQLNTSKEFYRLGEFNSAITNANDAEDTAEQAGGGLPLIPIIGAVVVLAAVVGGVFYYRSQQDTGHKLQ